MHTVDTMVDTMVEMPMPHLHMVMVMDLDTTAARRGRPRLNLKLLPKLTLRLTPGSTTMVDMSPTLTPTPSPTPMLLIITPLYTSQEGVGITWALWFPVPCDEMQQWIIKKTYAGSTKNIPTYGPEET